MPKAEIATRGRDDPWTVADEGRQRLVAARAPRQFEPTCRRRLANLVDDENGYSG